jgi:hypothetical protein
MTDLQLPSDEPVYAREGSVVVFNQLAIKIKMDTVSNPSYFKWLDRMTVEIGENVPGAQIAEKETARTAPPLNTAVYYDTVDYQILPTGALLRTSCNRITHAFCAFKRAQDGHNVRRDHRYVFEGEEKRTIQEDPTSNDAVAIVRRLLARKDIQHPGTYLEQSHGIRGEDLWPSICLDDYRYTFFVWLDQRDALRCSIDRAHVRDLRIPKRDREIRPFSEVELAIYPRIDPSVARDPRIVQLFHVLSASIQKEFGVSITRDIKYQRAAQTLGVTNRTTVDAEPVSAATRP